MNPPHVPSNYVQWAPGEYCHPSRVKEFTRLRGIGALPKVVAEMKSYAVPPKPPRRIRQDQKPLLNKLEQEALDCLQRVEPSDYIPQSIRFRLANGLWYKPDVVCFHQQACWEIKGPHSFRGGFENLKMAASKYPWFTWKLWWKEDGRWQEQIVLP